MKKKFNADKAEEYFTELRQYYIRSANEIFSKDNADRDSANPWYSAEFIRMKGKISAMDDVLEYFSNFELE